MYYFETASIDLPVCQLIMGCGQRGGDRGDGREGPLQVETREVRRAEHGLEGRFKLEFQGREPDRREIDGGVSRQVELPPDELQEIHFLDATAAMVYGVIDVVRLGKVAAIYCNNTEQK